jgi:recombination protein RecA
VRVKVAKNKVAPPFKQAEFDIMYGTGISREGTLLDLGVTADVVHKSGAFFSYNDERLGQGRAAARQFLRDNPDMADDIERQIRDRAGLPQTSAPSPNADPKGKASAAAALAQAEAETARTPAATD